MTFDLYAWSSPRELDADVAEALLAGWHASGGDPATSPFDPSTDVGWFHRELAADEPGLDISSDAVPSTSRTPIWLSTEQEPPARLVAIRLTAPASRDVLEDIVGLAAKYDLVLFDRRNHVLHRPLEELAEHASATFWPAGAVQAAVAGGVGAAVAVGAWVLAAPVVSGVLVVIGAFMAAMAVYTFVHEARQAARRRRTRTPPPS